MVIKDLYEIYLGSGLVSTDTRRIQPGSIFFALKGEHFNGNHFAAESLRKGASFAVIDEDIHPDDHRYIRVGDALKILQELAGYHRLKAGFTILAITGSNGKTTTKDLCRAILSRKFRVRATTGNLNNHIGVPLTLLAMEPTTDLGIVEMGANHPGEISFLCQLARPDYGLITNIGKAHLEGFGGIEGVVRAKRELFQYLIRNNKGIFVNMGNELVNQMVPGDYPHLVYYNGRKGLQAGTVTQDPYLSFEASDELRTFTVETRLLGNYNIENILAALTVGIHLGVAPNAAIEAVRSYEPGNNRSQLMQTSRNRIFMDAYNANPSSMQLAIDTFIQHNYPGKLMILGEMKELGHASDKEHTDLIAFLHSKGLSDVLLVGKNFETVAGHYGYPWFESADQLYQYLESNNLSDRFIFIKGSRSNNLEKILPLL
jgi:UDP-N-acetylmuramoyl-tripeptide--D-alanyl-D-alanine ligase